MFVRVCLHVSVRVSARVRARVLVAATVLVEHSSFVGGLPHVIHTKRLLKFVCTAADRISLMFRRGLLGICISNVNTFSV